MFRSWFLALVVCGLLATGANAQPQQAKVAATSSGAHELPPWIVPDIASLPDDENGKLVRYGKDLIDHTWALIGPRASNAAQRFTGNGLACTNCHIESGTVRYALPLVGIAGANDQGDFGFGHSSSCLRATPATRAAHGGCLESDLHHESDFRMFIS